MTPAGFPHSDISGSTSARDSPWLFAACHVLHRLLAPRHPPNALLTLEIIGLRRSTQPSRHGQEPSIRISHRSAAIRIENAPAHSSTHSAHNRIPIRPSPARTPA